MYNSDIPAKISSPLGAGEPRGHSLVIVAVLLIVLLTFAGLAIDMGHLYVARAELQRAADAGALAGAQALGLSCENPFYDTVSPEDVCTQVEHYAAANTCVSKSVVVTRSSDIKIGYLANPCDLAAMLQIVPINQCNAVEVVARRDTSNSSGEVGLFFGPIMGKNSSAVSASATAVLDDRFYGYRGGDAIPFALHADVWNDQIVSGNGADGYGYDKYTGSVTAAPDGVPEIQLFPVKLSGEEEGAGNFGLLNFGSSGASAVVEQITNGISKEDFVAVTGEPLIKFYDEAAGGPVTYDSLSYDIAGDPGLKGAVKNALVQKIGQVVGFFLYSTVAGEGANTVFTVVGMRFGRIMEVDLTGGDKIVVIQPVPYYGSGVLTSPNAPSTYRLIGRVTLVR